jgi:hypothetical protein
MFETDATWGTNPDLIRAYENILNDDLAGQTEQRKRARLLPAGIKPLQFEGYGEKFKDTLDDFLIASICGHFGVQPTEIGYNPKAGLGGAGFESGKAQNAELLGAQPLINWIGKMLTNLSYTYLNMPRELEVKLMLSKRLDNEDSARKAQIEVTSAGKTINERRSELGLPLLDTPQADMPILVAGSGTYLFSPKGIINAQDVLTAPVLDQDGNSKPELQEVEEITPEVQAEVKAFMKWVKKGNRGRAFEFKSIDPVVGEALNRCALDDDLDTARALAKAYLA